MTQGSTNTLDTVYTFDHNLYNDTLDAFYISPGWLLTIFIVSVLAIAFLLFDYIVLATIAFLSVLFFGIQVFNASIGAHGNIDEHYENNLRAYIDEHQGEFNDSVATWLASHDLTRDELCNSDTVINPDTLEPITADDTLICGTEQHSVQPGAFTLNDRDGAVVYGGEDHDRVVMSYRTPAQQGDTE